MLDNPAMKLQIPDREFAGYIFDCDGTLADTMPLHYRAWKRLLGDHGEDFDEEAFYSLGGMPTQQIFEHLEQSRGLAIADVEGAALLKEEYFVELLPEVRPIEQVVLIAQRWHGVKPLAVASGGLRKYVELTLDAIGIRSLFDAVVCVEDYARAKPFPDAFLEAARQLAVDPAHCLVFEDSPLGVTAAGAAGMQCIVVPRRHS